jgi:hypothetical protein
MLKILTSIQKQWLARRIEPFTLLKGIVSYGFKQHVYMLCNCEATFIPLPPVLQGDYA